MFQRLLLCAILALARISNAQTQIRLQAERQTDGTIAIKWSGENGKVYQLLGASNLDDPWEVRLADITSQEGTMSVAVRTSKEREFFRVREQPPLDGRILLTNGATLSSTAVLRVATQASGSNHVQYLELWSVDAQTGETNLLAWSGSPAELAPEIFTVDTTRLRNGSHSLVLKVVDDNGDKRTSEAIQTAWSDPPVQVYVRNPISLPFDGTTGWKFYLRFSSIYDSGTWSLTVTNELFTKSWSGSIEESTNRLGEIEVEDLEYPTDEFSVPAGYPGEHFDIHISVSRPGFPSLELQTRSKILTRITSGECVVAEEFGSTPATNRLNFELMMGTVLFSLNQHWDHFNLEALEREVAARNWNVLSNNTWSTFNRYLKGEFGRPPSHLYVWADGAPLFMGNRDITNSQITPRTLFPFNPRNRVLFAFLDGHNAPYGIARLLGNDKKRSRGEVLKEGRYPSFIGFWEGKRFSGTRSENDVDGDHKEAIEVFFESAFEIDLITGRPRKAITEALEDMKRRRDGTPNPAANYFRWLGCADMRVDEFVPDLY